MLYLTDYFLAWQFKQGEVFFCLLRSQAEVGGLLVVMVFVLYFCLYLYLYLYLYVNFLAFYILDQLHSSVAGRGILLSHRSHGWGRRAACYAVDLLTFLHTRVVAQFNSSCFAEMAAREKTKQTNVFAPFQLL